MEVWDALWSNGQEDVLQKAIPLLKAFGFKSPDVKDLEDRFLPAGCYPQFSPRDIWATMCLVADSVFLLDRQPPYQATAEARSLVIPWKSHTESEAHHRLKQEATEWLKVKQGVNEFLYEEYYVSGISDVMSKDGKWIVECGGSRPSKIWDFYRHENTKDNALIFFNDNGVTIFRAGPGLPEYMKLRRQRDAEIFSALDTDF